MTAPVPPYQPQPKKGRRGLTAGVIVALVVAVVVAVGAGQGWFSGSSAASPSADPNASVPGVVPADQDVVAEGRAVPARWIELQVAVPGTVTSVAGEGSTVAAGDALLALDDTAAKAQVAQAQAGVDAAAAQVASAKAAVGQAQAGADAADAAVDAAAAGVRVADAARDALPGAASNDQERQANAQVDQARAQLDQARASRTQARRAVTGAQASVKAAEADLARAKATLDAANASLADLTLTAPFAGTVVSVVPTVGDRVSPGAVVVRLADLSAWQFETSDLSETSIARVAVGAAAKVTVDGLPGVEIAGTVQSVGGYGASVQGDITYRVVVAPTGDVPAGLRWNMTVTIEITGTAAS